MKIDPTLNRIAHEQAAAMAAKDVLDHGVLGPFSSRVVPLRFKTSRRKHLCSATTVFLGPSNNGLSQVDTAAIF